MDLNLTKYLMDEISMNFALFGFNLCKLGESSYRWDTGNNGRWDE